MSIVAPEVFLVLYPSAAAVVGRRHRRVLLTAAAAAVVDPRVAQPTDPTRSSNVFLSVQKLDFSQFRNCISHMFYTLSTWHLTLDSLESGPQMPSPFWGCERNCQCVKKLFHSSPEVKNIKCEKYVSDKGQCLGHP